jgi:hypothetical protein
MRRRNGKEGLKEHRKSEEEEEEYIERLVCITQNIIIIITIFHLEFRPRWPVSVSAVMSSNSLLSGRPGRLPFG